MYEPESLKRWTLPDNYVGARWPNWYVFLGQHRDSDTLTRSNFICGLREIGGETETVKVIRENHWAVGWVEWIGIRRDDETALRKADEIKAALDDYPVVDESHWSEMEMEEAAEYWAQMPVRERAEYYCKPCGVSIFAARRDYLPEDNSGDLIRMLTE